MTLFDSIGKGVVGKMAGGKDQNALIGAVAQLINSPNVGGLSGLVQLFNRNGQGDTVASWISKGGNRPISPEAVQDTLGQDRIQHVAGAANMSEQDTSRGLASLLPQLVDKLTPDGKLPENDAAGNSLSQLAGRFLGGGS